MKLAMIETGPQIDSSVLAVYETMRDSYGLCDICVFEETECKMLLCGVQETLKLQRQLWSVGSYGKPIASFDKKEGLYNPFQEAYLADGDMVDLMEEMCVMLTEHAQRVEIENRPPYYLVPMPLDWETTFPYLLKGITSFMDRMIHDMRRG